MTNRTILPTQNTDWGFWGAMREHAADTGRLAALTASLGALNGRLREVHLATHIAMRDALGPEQRAAYGRMRGYTSGR